MEQTRVHGSFISERVSKIRWIPEELTNSSRFLTGSWGSRANTVSNWKFERNFYEEDEGEYIPKRTEKIEYNNDITGLELISNQVACVSFSGGFLALIRIKLSSDAEILEEAKRSKILHKFPTGDDAPCSGISVFEGNIATIGEDGRLNIVESNSLTTLRTIDNADNCSLTSVSYVNQNEIITGNRAGVLKLFDARSSSDNSESELLISCKDDKISNGVTSICYHPTQKHIILVGSEEGSITVWDLRQQGMPASYLSAHSNSITELAFHKTQPTKLFTASENGELWLWTQNVLTTGPISSLADNPMDIDSSSLTGDNVNPWLSGERAKNKISVTALITGIRKAINSLDSNGPNVICGCDSEAIYYIENMY